jgi:hypothetical protein
MPGRQYGWACLGLTDTFDGPSPAWQFSWPSAPIPSGDSSVAHHSVLSPDHPLNEFCG